MNNINERVLNETQIILKNGYTIREIAKMFKVSKSTVHKDLNDRLLKIDKEKHKEVSKILEYHMDIRHLRGGESTKNKYLNSKEG